MPHALVVDDEKDAAEMMATLIAAEGYTVATAGSLRDARRRIAMQPPDLVLLDVVLPDGSGTELLDELKALPSAEVVLITGHASVESSVQALRMGAADYLNKPLSLQQLRGVLARAKRPSTLRADAEDLFEALDRDGHFGLLWGRSAPMRRVYEQIVRVAGTAVTVFSTGESGTGKELVARTVHDLSRRRGKPFLAVNCGAISPNLIESEIFGHEKGSFTGAERQHLGFFERANGGTLFLDEITEMPLDLQVKLLRALQEGEIDPIGSKRPVKVDIRLISATNRDLIEQVKQGRFREDLFYRLNVFPIGVPSLRARRDDIPDLARRFAARFSAEEGKRLRGLSSECAALLTRYDWPGNVRQLENAVFRAVVLADGDELTVTDFPQIANHVDGFDVRVPPLPFALAQAPALAAREIVRVEVRDPNVAALLDASGHVRKFDALEAEVIAFALAHYRGRMSEVARRLGIGRSTLYRKMKEFGLDGAEGEAAA